MHLPLSYPIRNLTRRPWSVAMTVAGIAVVVFAATVMLALCRGLYHRLDVSGDSSNVLMISRKGQNVMFSNIEADELSHVLAMPGLAADENGSPLVSPELMHISSMKVATADGAVARESVSIRGVQPVAYYVHRLGVLRGRVPENSFELFVGCSAHVKLGVRPDDLAPGKTLRFEDRD
jgi:putative ABC transport system permease protein